MYWSNCILKDSTIDDYYYNGATTNWAYWLFIFIMMSYFMINAFSSDDMSLYYHKETKWSHHPVYSIHHLTLDIFTKLMRLSILFVYISSFFLFIAIFTRAFGSEAHLAVRLIIYPIGAVIWALIPVYLCAY